MNNLLLLNSLRRKRNRLLAFTLFAATFAFAACDGGGGDSDGDDGSSEPNRRGGQVTLISFSDSTEGGFAVVANFWGVYGTPNVACQKETFGSCELIECPSTNSPLEGEYATGSYRAGRITVEGGLQSAVLEAGATFVNGTGDFFRGGERLTVRAEGGEVPAFEGSVLAPGRVVFTEPRATPGPKPEERTFVVSPGRDLTVRWTGGVAGTRVRAFVNHDGDPNTFAGPSASCTFDAGAGTGVIPATALERLAKSTPSVSLHFRVDSETRVETGDVSVVIGATAPAVDANGIVFSGPVRFE